MAILTARRVVLAVMLASWLGASDASAQVFGTFSWRMEPYCNIVTLTITQFPAGYTLDGNDNQCGSGRLAGATGQVLINPNGTVGIDFIIVTTPSAVDVRVLAVISPATGSGTWSDSTGNSGTFLLGAPGSGSPRPVPNVVRFRAHGHTAQAAAGSELVAKWSSLDYNVGGGTYDAAAGTFAVPSPGTYLITSQGRWTAFGTAAGYKCLYVYVDGGRRASNCEAPSTTAGFQIQQLTTVLTLPASSSIAIRALNFTGGAGTFGGCSSVECGFTVTKLP